ncbi:MAG: tail fiber domain-containing protein [Candidatus Saccharimonadales bacterium]
MAVAVIVPAQAAPTPVRADLTFSLENTYVITGSDGSVWTAPEGGLPSRYVLQGDTSECPPYLKIASASGVNHVTEKKDATGSCVIDSEGPVNFKTDSAQNFLSLYYWIDMNTIGRFKFGDKVGAAKFTRVGDTTIFTSGGECTPYLMTNASNPAEARFVASSTERDSTVYFQPYIDDSIGRSILSGISSLTPTQITNLDIRYVKTVTKKNGSNNCYESTGYIGPGGDDGIIKLSLTDYSDSKPGEGINLNNSSAPGGNTTEPDICDVFGNWSLRWLVCPIFTVATELTNALDSIISSLLEYNVDSLLADDSGIRKAWETFRAISLSLLVIAALVMVISQAAGMNFLDAYTIKKILPRLLIAIIGIALSWEIMKFVITFFNDLGAWIGAIIESAFGTASADTENPAWAEAIGWGITTGGGVAGGVALTALGVASIGYWGPLALSLLGTAALACIIGLVVLGLRAAIISAAVVFAPVAIAAYILPGTKKVWDFWQNTFITALLMYPLVFGFIALGRGLAFVVNASNTDTSPGMKILVFILWFGPYFLLPFAFKLAGGLMKTIFSIADDKSKGFFDKQRKFRSDRKQAKVQAQIDGKQGGVLAGFRQRSAAARHGHSALGKAYRGSRQNYMEQVRNKSMQDGGSILSNDEVMRRVKDGMSEHDFVHDRSQELYQDAERAYMATNKGVAPTAVMVTKMKQAAQNQAKEEAGRVHAALGSFGTDHARDVATMAGMSSGSFYNSKDYHTDLNEMLGDLAAMRNRGSITEGDAIGLMGKFMAKRPDMAKMGSGTKYSLLTQATANVAANKDAVDANTARAALVDSMSHMTSQDHMLVDGRSAQKSAHALKDYLQHTATTFGKGSTEYARAAATAGHIYESMSMAPPENRNYFADLVYSQEITDNGNAAANTITFTDGSTKQLQTQTMLQDMKALAQTERYQHGKKEWDTQAGATGAATAGGPPPAAGGGGGGAGGTAGGTSDKRLKRDIHFLGQASNGIRLYSFKYLWSNVTYVGVMAQDLLESHPEAVATDDNGFYRVNYEMLGLEMKTFEEWQKTHSLELNSTNQHR